MSFLELFRAYDKVLLFFVWLLFFTLDIAAYLRYSSLHFEKKERKL